MYKINPYVVATKLYNTPHHALSGLQKSVVLWRIALLEYNTGSSHNLAATYTNRQYFKPSVPFNFVPNILQVCGFSIVANVQ